MGSTNRWLGLALVGVLALVAQPAAVVDGPAQAASTADPQPRSECSALDDLQRTAGEPLPLAVEASVPDIGACLDENGELVPVDGAIAETTDVGVG